MRAIRIFVHQWQHHPASTLAKILSLPVMIPMIIFFTIRDFVSFLSDHLILLVSVALLTLILTGCAGWTWEDEMNYQAGGSGLGYTPAAPPAGTITIELTPEQEAAAQRAGFNAEMQTLEMQRQNQMIYQQINDGKDGK